MKSAIIIIDKSIMIMTEMKYFQVDLRLISEYVGTGLVKEREGLSQLNVMK